MRKGLKDLQKLSDELITTASGYDREAVISVGLSVREALANIESSLLTSRRKRARVAKQVTKDVAAMMVETVQDAQEAAANGPLY